LPPASYQQRAKARLELERRREIRACLEGSQGVPGPLYWLQNHTETFDEKWKEHGLEPYRPFPKLPYLPWLFNHFVKDRRLFVPKSREMLASWSVVGYAVWLCQFQPRQRVMANIEDMSQMLLDHIVDLLSTHRTRSS
jgi:hypothetical protein